MSQEIGHNPRCGAAAAPRSKTPEQATASLMRLCARAEKCSGDALRLMHRWGVAADDARKVLQRLQSERFIDDGRYAAAYVREKSRLSGWGERKIAASLRAKGIAPAHIQAAMEQLDQQKQCERLALVLQRKAQSIKYKDVYDFKAKLVRYGLGRGFSLDDVLAAVEDIARSL